MSGTVLKLLLVVGQTLAIYLFLIVALSRLGRREMAQLTLTDYLIIALLGSSVETGLYVGSSSLAAGLVSAATLLVTNRSVIFFTSRFELVRSFLVGTPIVLVRDGQILRSQLRRAQLTERDVMQGIRLRGHDKLDEVGFAVLEANGAISVVPKSKSTGRDR